MALTLFDLDNTLLSGDSDYEWGQFLVEKNLVDKKEYEEANRIFYQQYQDGTLDIIQYSAFSFKPLSVRSMEELATLHQEFMQEIIKPLITKKARKLVEKHHQSNDTVMIITATNSFITAPIGKEFGIGNLLATEPRIVNGRYTTDVEGVPCFQDGKVTRLNQWLKENNANLQGSTFYSDSINDLSLLEIVDKPIAVDPDESLKKIALQKDWGIISLR